MVHEPEGHAKPGPKAFELSHGDEEEAARRELPNGPRLSVWDDARATVEEVCAAREYQQAKDAGRDVADVPETVPHDPDRHGTPYVLRVRDIEEVRDTIPAGARLRVVRDPLSELPFPAAASAHAGLEGLKRMPGTPKAQMLLVRKALADRCTPALGRSDEASRAAEPG